MKLIEKGDFKVKIKYSSKDEIGKLARTFNSMARKMNNLINEVYFDKLKQKDLEVQMLQNQINPHFLYNTLESIHMMAKINKDAETSRMAVALGKILRYSINRNQERVTVREEIEHLKDYIMLQKVRFEDIFDIEVNVDESLNEKNIIKLILQPIVENAVYHGMDSVESGGKIEIIGYEKENNIIFEVIDNGIGMDEKLVEKMNNYINDLDDTMKSIGLKNVNKRIQLHYGSEYGVKVFSKQGIGTRVQVTIPLNV
jgi:two-component system sensor histidine kinase YesM